MTHSTPFDDLALDATEKSFRLFRLRTEIKTPGIHLELAAFNTETSPDYIALSYAWGSENDKAAVRVNGSSIHITRSLSDFISTIVGSGLRKADLQNEGEDILERPFTVTNTCDCITVPKDQSLPTLEGLWFWADQISMNQQDVLERNHQVSMMGDIFSKAASVWAWIGPRPVIANINLKFYQDYQHETALDTKDFEVLDSLNMFHRPYWTRLWIVQELRLNLSCLFWCGNVLFTKDSLFHRFSFHLERQLIGIWELYDKQYRLGEQASEANVGAEDLYSIGRGKRDVRLGPMEMYNTVHQLLSGWGWHGKAAIQLEDVIEAFSRNFCTDARDKIYGLQMLVEPRYRMQIDYSQNLQEVVLGCVKTMIKTATDLDETRRTWSFVQYPNPGRGRCFGPTGALDLLMKAAQISEDDANRLAWGHMTAMLSADLSERRGLLTLERRRPWLVEFCKQDIWAYVKHYAISERQKQFGLELFTLVTTGRLKAAMDRMFHERSKFPDPMPKVEEYPEELLESLDNSISDLAWVVKQLVGEIAVRHGFMMYEDFLSHPEDWIPRNEKPTHVFDLRLKQWRNVRSSQRITDKRT